MAQAPDRIADDIEQTRSDLVRDVDALADRTLPNRVARRRWTGMKETMRTVSDRVMGTSREMTGGESTRSMAHRVSGAASQAGAKAGELASDVAGTAREAPQMVARQAQGNPIAAGIIAFGVGLLAASMAPTTELERRAGRQLKESTADLVEPVKQPLTDSAQQLRQDVTQSVGEAAEQVKQTAGEAARATAGDAKEAAQGAAERTKQASSGSM